ncbi:leucine-rich colipase-like protein 1 [Desmodus rotundus]|uniref:leucine-rich colipase-like protein 1 n=1 Tax=Desmodus rotundus TaxID=9430 RepID=UPI002380ED75|nr:leucine-rich colipase-like protein 1 [Desmodus rotundus]
MWVPMRGALGAEVALDVGTLLDHLGVDRPAGPMALARHLLLLLLLLPPPCMLPVSSTMSHKAKSPSVLLPPAPRLAPGLASECTDLTLQGIGEPCEDHVECQSDCCATSSLNPQKYCTSQTVFQKCLSWRKPNGYSCSDHTHCRSNCCVTNSYSPLRYCTPRTVFFQCLYWRKPNRDYCLEHSECRSQCCLSLTEATPPRCTPRSGILAQCLPPKTAVRALAAANQD